MTAYRVIDVHTELSGIGITPHVDIDTHITSSAFVVTSGSTNVPPNARLLTAGTGVEFNDHGPGSTLEISVSGVSGSLPPASGVGQVLFSTDGSSFAAVTPLVSQNGWLLNSSGTLLAQG